MWTSILGALTALLLLSDPANARFQKRVPTEVAYGSAATGVATTGQSGEEYGSSNIQNTQDVGSSNANQDLTGDSPNFPIGDPDGQPGYTQAPSSAGLDPTGTLETQPESTETATSSGINTGNGNTNDAGSKKFRRGVNLGGWLVLEEWMTKDLFEGTNAKDQYTFDALPDAKDRLEKHWKSYFTEDDIKKLAAAGITDLRIPIGFWATDNKGTPYRKGADDYMKLAIGWARNAGMKVLVDCHGSPGSQNGFDNSGQAGEANWQKGDNMERSITILETMAEKWGSTEYADVVFGLQLTNEPISWGNNDFQKTQEWTKKAYAAVKAKVTNPNLEIIMHDAFKGVGAWVDMGKELNQNGGNKFGIDTHKYQLFDDSDKNLTQKEHITKACSWGDELAQGKAVMPTYVGEWSAATNICVNPDGSTTAGTECQTEGCQCQGGDWTNWNDKMKEQIRRFVDAQLDTFEAHSDGYFLWSAKGPGGWGFLNLIDPDHGVLKSVAEPRKYPGQCGGGGGGGGGAKRRVKRGSLGAVPEAF